MRVGVLLSAKPSGTDVAGCYDQLIATARQAELDGFSCVWIGEHHFSNDRPEPVPLILGGAVAAETSTRSRDQGCLALRVKHVHGNPLVVFSRPALRIAVPVVYRCLSQSHTVDCFQGPVISPGRKTESWSLLLIHLRQ